MEEPLLPGLGTLPEKEWPKVPASSISKPPIDRLTPTSPHHQRVLDYLLNRIHYSELKMSQFYPRWRASELRTQAYIDLDSLDRQLKQQNDDGKPPQITNVRMPYEFATIWTIVTYLMQVYVGRRPIWSILPNKAGIVDNARNMETLLQYNADHVRLAKQLYLFLQDSQVYGLGVLRTSWAAERRLRTRKRAIPQFDYFGAQTGETKIPERVMETVFEGNYITSLDPFMFFPDPRVPFHEVNKKGEFVAFREYIGKHELLKAAADGDIKWLKYASNRLPTNRYSNESSRNYRSLGEAIPGAEQADENISNFYQIDQISIELVPAELGLGEQKRPEIWTFAIANKSQIIQAEPSNYDHGMHPCAAIEPLALGYGLGNLGIADMLGPIGDSISWLVNSHMDNVRRSLNNMWIVDPSRIEMQDLRKPGPGKYVRLKQAAWGTDVQTAIQQLAIQDVTRTHIADLDVFMRLGEKMSSVTENLMGLQDRGSRKSATEVRRASDAGASRLAMMATLISAQGMLDIAQQMSLNYQQYLSEEFELQVLGEEAMSAPIRISPDTIVGDFYFPIHDGTLPVDKVAMLDVWKEIMMAVMGDQELRQNYSVPRMFEWIAKLGGASNISNFKVEFAPGAQLQAEAGKGNIVPMTPGMGQQMLQGQA